MRILKEGKLPNLWIGKCRHCGSIYEAVTYELRNIIEDDIITCKESHSEENCNFCGSNSTISFRRQSSRTGQQILSELN